MTDLLFYCELKCRQQSCMDALCQKPEGRVLSVFVALSGSSRPPGDGIVVQAEVASDDPSLLQFIVDGVPQSKVTDVRLEVWPEYSNSPHAPYDFAPGTFKEKSLPITISPQDSPCVVVCIADFRITRTSLLTQPPEKDRLAMNIHIPERPFGGVTIRRGGRHFQGDQ